MPDGEGRKTQEIGNDSLLNTVAELFEGIVVPTALNGLTDASNVLLTAVDLAGGFSNAGRDAWVKVARQLLSKDGAERSKDDDGGLHGGA